MIDMQIDARSMRLLESALKAADKKTNKTAADNIDNAMYFIARSAGAAMKPKARTKREIMPNPTRTGRGRTARGAKYQIKVLHQDKPATYIYTNKKSDKRRKIQKLGLAANVMRIAAGKFGTKPGGKSVKGSSKLVKIVRKHTLSQHKAAIITALTYVMNAFPGVIDRAMKKGLTVFIRKFDRDWATALKGQKWA